MSHSDSSKKYRLETRRDALQTEWDQRHKKLARLRQALVSESGEARKFELEEQIQAEEEETKHLEQELDAIEQALENTAPAESEDWIAEVRSRSRQMVAQYNSIRLLNQTEITVDQLYVDVWLLKRPTQTLQPGAKMFELFDLRNDRLGLGDRDIRADGMKIANETNRLLILGKPGAGKTTFLKHLAVDCSKERFQANLIPVLIELRRIRSTEWKLLDAISEQLGSCC
jgi:predicted NACHT family NTPase